MGRNPHAGKVSKSINTSVETEVVKAEELNRPEVVEIQPIDKNKKKRVKENDFK